MLASGAKRSVSVTFLLPLAALSFRAGRRVRFRADIEPTVAELPRLTFYQCRRSRWRERSNRFLRVPD
jgi:hypothetical protein